MQWSPVLLQIEHRNIICLPPTHNLSHYLFSHTTQLPPTCKFKPQYLLLVHSLPLLSNDHLYNFGLCSWCVHVFRYFLSLFEMGSVKDSNTWEESNWTCLLVILTSSKKPQPKSSTTELSKATAMTWMTFTVIFWKCLTWHDLLVSVFRCIHLTQCVNPWVLWLSCLMVPSVSTAKEPLRSCSRSKWLRMTEALWCPAAVQK